MSEEAKQKARAYPALLAKCKVNGTATPDRLLITKSDNFNRSCQQGHGYNCKSLEELLFCSAKYCPLISHSEILKKKKLLGSEG